MVMHARKPQRMSDGYGYFEKHQAHPYQKYSNSRSERRTASEYVSSDNRFIQLRSPNGNVPAHTHTYGSYSGHGHHHYSHMADDRGYYASSRNAYMQKVSEKERDRDYKSYRNKYTVSDGVRSPKEKRNKDCERERSNHERSETEKKSRISSMNVSVSRSSKYDKRIAPPARPSPPPPPVSDWSEHISSSGKKYYYNCVSEVSQWEKPREWDSKRISSKDSTYSTRSNRDKRSRSRSRRRESEKCSKRTNSSSDRHWNNSGRDDDGNERTRSKHSMASHEIKDGQSLQDMDISPDRSTLLSENSYGARETNSTVRNKPENNPVPPVVVLDNSNQTSGSLLAAALPRIVAAAAPAVSVASVATVASVASVAALPGAVSTCVVPNNGDSLDDDIGSPGTPLFDTGPPTPTHAESMDPHAPPLHLEAILPRKMECLGSYSSVVGGTVQPAALTNLTPSLINYVRGDLTAHVMGWPADILEKQVHKFSEEAYQLGCLQCTRVSSELKCSRSIVRHTEIQATLQEQKIMYLRQQITRLEELKSQNSFMSED